MQAAFGFAYTLGWPLLNRAGADYDHGNLIVVRGANPAYSATPMGNLREILKAKERGAKLIVIKPETQPDAAKADIWVPIRPGTDGALGLAMLHVIVNENLYDAELVSKWCYGLDELVPHIKKYSPEWAGPITGLPHTQIREIARSYATTKPAYILTGNAFEHTTDSSNAVRAAAILIAITGNLNRPGGSVVCAGITMPMVKSVHPRERYTQDFVDRLVGPETGSCFQPLTEGTSSAYYRCLNSVLTRKPYPIRTIIAPGTQPTMITRGSKSMVEALEKLEFFVVIDVMQNASMPCADIVVPVATMYECHHRFEVMGNWMMARNKFIEPLGDYKSDYEFWLDLAVGMDYGKDFWDGSIEKCMNYQLQNFGMTMEELRARTAGIVYEPKPMVYEKHEEILATPSPRLSKAPYPPQGKVAIYNTRSKRMGSILCRNG